MIRIALYEKEPKTLKVKIEYDELTIGKIKKIPGRKYRKNEGKIWTRPYKYLNRLTDMFDESEIIYEPHGFKSCFFIKVVFPLPGAPKMRTLLLMCRL